MAAEFEFTRFGLKFREIMFKNVKDFKLSTLPVLQPSELLV